MSMEKDSWTSSEESNGRSLSFSISVSHFVPCAVSHNKVVLFSFSSVNRFEGWKAHYIINHLESGLSGTPRDMCAEHKRKKKYPHNASVFGSGCYYFSVATLLFILVSV